VLNYWAIIRYQCKFTTDIDISRVSIIFAISAARPAFEVNNQYSARYLAEARRRIIRQPAEIFRCDKRFAKKFQRCCEHRMKNGQPRFAPERAAQKSRIA
jgi:hypothetical protein